MIMRGHWNFALLGISRRTEAGPPYLRNHGQPTTLPVQFVSPTLASISAIVLALGTTEGLAYWWMHPAPAGLDQPVLCYRPGVGRDRRARPLVANGVSSEGEADVIAQRPEVGGENVDLPTSQDPATVTDRRYNATDPLSSIHDPLSSLTDNGQQTTDNSSSYTPLPEIVAKSLPSLHCATGTAARIDRDDGTTIHLAFFEWDLADSTSVLEAYKHLPDQCMGSIGLTLIEHRPPRSYQVGGETLSFDHTVFHDPRGVIIQAFKGTWVSGANGLLGNGLRGGMEQWRQLHFRMALKRFRPAYSRVAQGAVRGIANPDRAWQAFQDAMLCDLKFESR